jgi:ABC-2 type transport system ATP-binding protein
MIEVKDLSKNYGERSAISHLNFHVKKGEVVGFLGPNGAGKSTTMKIITGFLPATQGSVVVNGFDVFEKPKDVKRSIGFLPETPPVYLDMTVQSYVEFVAALHGVEKSKIATMTQAALEKTSLMDVRHRLIGNLSKGYRQRVGIAQALAHNPAVLILDEPTVGLDPKQILEIRKLIKSLAGDHTVILSSHILPEITATCERVIIINKGKIITEDTIDNLTQKSKKGRIFHLSVKKITKEAVQEIQNLSDVQSVQEIKPLVLEITMKNGSDEARDQIIEIAVKNHLGLIEFSAHNASLEEVFLELITVEQGA